MNLNKKYPMSVLPADQFPKLLQHINDPPKRLYIKGTMPSDEAKFLCVVGSRACSSYGKEACEKLIFGLRGYNIVVVSGLALGIDAIAHRAAFEAGLLTVAIPGSGIDFDVLYPSENRKLALQILDSGGAIISEEEPCFKAAPYSFPKRNRIMAGMSHAVLVVEAKLKSGTLITAKYATDYNRDVLVVPGSIFSSKSDGPHMLMCLGATPVRTSGDILEALGFSLEKDSATATQAAQKIREQTLSKCSPDEHAVLQILTGPMTRDELIRTLTTTTGKPVADINSLLVMMEIRGLIEERGGEIFIT